MATTTCTAQLWFDVGFKTYTTSEEELKALFKLWFDVGFKTYTTYTHFLYSTNRCGLM